jgi:hypothetical protein
MKQNVGNRTTRAGRPISSNTELAVELRRRHWTTKDLADRLSTSYRNVQRWTRGQTPTPAWVWESLKNIDRLEVIRKAARG